jgi:hypothetical protein
MAAVLSHTTLSSTVNRKPGWNWWKWTIVAGVILIAIAVLGGAIGWAKSGG